MARCRNLKPSFFTNELLGDLPALTRLLFAGLWTIADREGRLQDRPKRIKTEILPYDDYDIEKALNQLARGADPFIVRYAVGGFRFIQIVKFRENQTPHHTEKSSVIPEPPLSSWSITTDQLAGHLEVRGSEEGSSEVQRPRQKQISAASIPVPEGFETPEVRQAISDWLDFKAKRGKPYKDAGFFGRKVAEFVRAGPAAFVAAVNSSIGNNYDGIFPAKDINGNSTTSTRVGPGQRYQGG